MNKEKNKKKCPEVNEPMSVYYTKMDMQKKEIPDYIWEDVRIGMEQYRRGEYSDAMDFMKSLRK